MIMTSLVHRNTPLFQSHRLLGLLFLLGGMFSLTIPYLLETVELTNRSLQTGIAFTAIGLITSSLFKGYLFDLKGRRLKAYQSILGFKFGSWQKLDQLASIRQLVLTEESTNLPNGITPTLSGTTVEHLVILLNAKEEPLAVICKKSEEQARTIAKSLSDGLNIRLEEG